MERFRANFVAAWDRVPRRVRHAVVSHWSRSPGGMVVEVADYWSGWSVGLRAQVVTIAGRVASVRFHAPVFERVPDNYAQFLIAHELAHICQAASGNNFTTIRQAESDADEKAVAWLGLTNRPRSPALASFDRELMLNEMLRNSTRLV